MRLILLFAACSLPLDGARCPCTSGYLCCKDSDICVADGQRCPGDGCVPGENCPGDPLPDPPQGKIDLNLAQFPDGVIEAGRDLVVTFPIVVTELDRNATFTLAPSAFLSGSPPTTLITAAFDENDQPITNIVLPKTDVEPHRKIVKVKVKIPPGTAQMGAWVTLGLTYPQQDQRVARFSSGQVQFTIGSPAPPANAFSIDYEYLVAGKYDSFDPEYGALHLRSESPIIVYLRADLSAFPPGDESYSFHAATDGTAWSAYVCANEGTCMPNGSVVLTTPGQPDFYLVIIANFDQISTPPQDIPTQTVDIVVQGTNPQHRATVHYSVGI
jgi:hypothetical protein